MGDLAIGLGVILAILGPLLLIPVAWLVYRVLALPVALSTLRPGTSLNTTRWIAAASSCVAVSAIMGISYLPGRVEFNRLCSEHGVPIVSDRVTTPGFYRSRLYPYEARQLLENNAFTFVEAPHVYERGAFVRYSQTAGGEIREEEVTVLDSTYGVKEELRQLSYGLVMTEKVVYDMNTERELARAADVLYQGGPLSLFLGTFAMSSCPDIRSPEGSRHFDTFYHLESIVLREADRTWEP